MPLVKEIEALDKLRSTGRLTQSEYAAAKAAILAEIPEAEQVGAGPDDPPLLAMLLPCLAPPLILGVVVNLAGIPPMLSLTLGVTLLAAIVIAKFRAT